MEQIRMIHFVGKLNEVYLAIENIVDGITVPDVKNFLLGKMTTGLEQLVSGVLVKAYKGEDIKEKIVFTVEEIKKMNVKIIENYPNILINLCLVLLCTVLEIFLNHILIVVIRTRPETLISMAPEKEITLKKVLELKDYDLIFNDFETKTLEHFSRQSIKKRLEMLRDLGIKLEELFEVKDEVQHEYVGWDLAKLEQVFQQRHDIVHKNESPLKSIKEAWKIWQFFEVITLNLSVSIHKKYNIPIDFFPNKQLAKQ